MPSISSLFRGVVWVPVGALLLAWGLSATPFLERIEVLAQDTQKRLAARPHFFADALVIDIDDTSLAAMQPYFGSWPYKRETYGLLVDYLGEMGARAVVFDIVMSDARAGDESFRASIHRNANVVLATSARFDAPPPGEQANPSLNGLGWQVPPELRVESWPSVQPPLPLFTQPAPSYARVGIVSAIPEQDGMLRRIPLFHRFDDKVLPAISLAAHFPKSPLPSVQVNPDSSVQVGTLSVPVDPSGALHLYFPSNDDAVVSVSFSQVGKAMLGMAGSGLDATSFKGKTVFVGSTAFFTDRVLTPVGEMKGVNVLALIHQSMAQGLLLKPSGGVWSGLLLLMSLVPSALLLIRPGRSLLTACLLGLAALALIYATHFALLYWLQQESALLLPLLVAALALLLETVLALRAMQTQRAATLNTLTHMDALTGLPNRQSMQTELTHLIEQAERLRGVLAVLLIDLDHFQTINTTLSRKTGDQLLLEVRDRLKSCLQPNESASRLGSDEFAVIVGGADKATAIQSAERILAALNQPYLLADQPLHITASMGIGLFPNDGSDGAVLLQNADTALTHAKAQGRNTYRFFTQALSQNAIEQMRIENQLRQAIAQNELVLHYQPLLDLASGKIQSAEALVRWQHPVLGLLSPAQFIATAEKSKLILALDDWVLHTACQQMKRWQQAGLAQIHHVSVNLSARQFDQPDLPKRVAKVLEQTQLDAKALTLEITESLAMTNPQHAVDTLNQLKKMGIALSLDDFGMGHSSFSYLRHFPINGVKVDQSFVNRIETDRYDAEICSAMIALAHKLGLETVAEGVETPGQLEILKGLGCNKVQGYLVSRPLSAPELEQLLRSESSASV